MVCNRFNRARLRLAFEALERRELLAGDVTAILDSRGTLRIVGDAKANCVELDFSAKLSLRGCIAGGEATAINGVRDRAVTFSGPVRPDIVVNLRAGDDILRVGDGAGTLSLDDVRVDAGDGQNQVIIASDTSVNGELRIQTGSGEDKVDVSAQVRGRLIVATGSQRDVLSVRAGTIEGTTLINTGAGNDRVSIEAMRFLGQVTVSTDSGTDFTEVDDSTFAEVVDIVLGQENDSLYVGGRTTTGSIFQSRSVRFNGGAGTGDRYAIENSTFAGSPLIGDLVTGFEFEVDDRSFLEDTGSGGTPPPSRNAKYRDCTNSPLVAGANLRKCDLRPLAIVGLNLSNADMRDANLAGMNLDVGPDDARTNLTGVKLAKADATGTVFSNTIMLDADMNRVLAVGASFEDTTLAGADLTLADLRNAKFFFTDAREAIFRRANLAGAELRGANLPDTDFNRADLRNVDATAARLMNADLTLANLTGADLTRADLTGANLHRAQGLDSVIWSNTICPDGTNSDSNAGTCIGHL